MSETVTMPPRADESAATDSSCSYLAKQFVAKHGFTAGTVLEAEALVAASDIVLTLHNGAATLYEGAPFTILCLIDREANPDRTFDLSLEELERIGDACTKYASVVPWASSPEVLVAIRVVEVGPTSSDRWEQLKRLTTMTTTKCHVTALAADTASNEVLWNSRLDRPERSFIEEKLRAPRERDEDVPSVVVATAPPSFPVVTSAILATLSAVFAAEIAYGIGSWTKTLQPSLETLVALGGLQHDPVLKFGQWFRLFSAPFLHLDAGHLAMNCIALLIAGSRLEIVVGRAWFGMVYVVGAISGSLLSLAFNPATIVAVGASGAIMALFAAMLVTSYHFPAGALRGRMQASSVYVLISSLLPFASNAQGQKIDYAAHFGGAIGGAAVGIIMLAIWSRTEPLPRFRQATAAVAIAGVMALAYPAISVLRSYQAIAGLIPPSMVPKTSADIRVHAVELITRYPHDPRPRLMRAADLLDANDLAGAEHEARAALVDESAWQVMLGPQLGDNLRVILALAINDDRPEEALRTARPACARLKQGPARNLLDDKKLCRM
jgi:rhomboid protease GluP